LIAITRLKAVPDESYCIHAKVLIAFAHYETGIMDYIGHIMDL